MPRTLSETDGCKQAFVCKQCGHLHSSDDGGELPHPSKCRMCGAGCSFRHQELTELARKALAAGNTKEVDDLLVALSRCDPTSKTLYPDNWEHLHEVTPERLAELGLKPEHVIKHEPWKKPSDAEISVAIAHKIDVNDQTTVAEAIKETKV